MKGIICVCIVVLSGLFLYKPSSVDYPEQNSFSQKEIAPELKECKYYQQKIEENLKEARREE